MPHLMRHRSTRRDGGTDTRTGHRLGRRHRTDFGRATADLLSMIRPDQPFSTEVLQQLCSAAMTTCGADRAAVLQFERGDDDTDSITPLAYASGHDSRSRLVPMGTDDKIPLIVEPRLIRRALAQGGLAATADILVGIVNNGADLTSGSMAPIPRFVTCLALQLISPDMSAAQSVPTPGFTDVDRRRMRVLCALVSLGQNAYVAAATGDLLLRASNVLATEANPDRRIELLAALLAEAADADHCLVWVRPYVHCKELRLRAAHGVADPTETRARATSSSLQRKIQSDLAGLTSLDQPAAIAASALPWINELMGQSDGPQISQLVTVVTPIRRRESVVGIAMCAREQVSEEAARAWLSVEKRSLLTALADQIALTTEYARSATSAEASAKRFALLAAVGEVALAKMGMDELLDAILTKVQDYFESSVTSLFILGSDRSSLRTRSLRAASVGENPAGQDIRVPLMSGDQTFGSLSIRPPLARQLNDDDHETLVQVADQIALALATSGRYEIQASLAVLDALTGLPNRRSAEESLERAFAQATRDGTQIAIALLDIDHFKEINDNYGHTIGDKVLQEVARMFKAHLRPADVVARFGGEEFLIILPNVDKKLARRICERLRHSVSLTRVRQENGQPIPVTASLGGACYPLNGLTCALVVASADKALYAAKTSGRNRLCWALEH